MRFGPNASGIARLDSVSTLRLTGVPTAFVKLRRVLIVLRRRRRVRACVEYIDPAADQIHRRCVALLAVRTWPLVGNGIVPDFEEAIRHSAGSDHHPGGLTIEVEAASGALATVESRNLNQDDRLCWRLIARRVLPCGPKEAHGQAPKVEMAQHR